ncbi:MAG: metallophosphoesterase family protein, partial [Clostridia bacterium]|nr:metallophosphoesterase family protein [Clostridia bacterium]
MKVKKLLSVLLVVILVFSFAAPSASALTKPEAAHLSFNENGKFRILNFSDSQDGPELSLFTKTFMKRAVKEFKPDLVVLTGDNIAGYLTQGSENTEAAIRQFMDIFAKANVPVAIVFGNHDDEEAQMSKEDQMKIYESYPNNISFDEGEEIDGVGTYNVPIYSSKDYNKVAFNLWMMDSGTYDTVYGGYDHVKQSQLDWYKETSDTLAEENGGKVPSIAFQHIIVPEIHDALKEVPEGTPGAISAWGTYYVLPDNAAPGSILGEPPCPSNYNSGEFETFCQQGDVLAIVTGHDHVNSFRLNYKGIDLINTPTCGFASYGDEQTRGVRVIDIDENDPENFETQVYLLKNVIKKDIFVFIAYKFYVFGISLG